MTPANSTELLDWLVRNQFLAPDRGNEVRAQVAAFPDAHGLCKELLRRDWLTPYQVNQLLQGKGDSLMFGPNRVLSRLGEGAMGTVFKAWNTRLGKLVAIKTIAKEHVAKEQAMKRFLREIATASQLDHPNIVLVRDADEAQGNPYLAMDYIDGIDLAKRVKQDGALPVPLAIEYARQAALGLQHAFERDVVHRDIKPSNLLVSKSASPEQTPVVKILDFGLARFASEQDNANRLTQFNKILGTVDYIAPEQIDNARGADIRSDIYSLGCTLYYLLAAKPPFPGADLVAKLTARISGTLPRIREVRPEAPAGLEEVMVKMMARLPDDRYQTPNEVAAALASLSKATNAEMKPVSSGQVLLAKVVAPTTGLPVPSAAVLIAKPVMATAVTAVPPTSVPSSTDDSLGFGETSASPPSRPRPTTEKAPAASSTLLIGGAAGLVMALIGLVLMFRMVGCSGEPAKKGYLTPGAAVRLKQVESRIYTDGAAKPLLVEIEREKFSGPVKVEFDPLPQGLSSEAIWIPSNKKQGEMRLTVSYGTSPFAAKLRITATAENLTDETFLDFTLKSSRNQ
ncbi:MAG: serine/threonine protein kinase [Gemmataceae bacterium]|nr:serine/threonine protein kinase [Gemmataceae bacterium]